MSKFIDFVNNNKFFCCFVTTFILIVITLLFILRINMYDRFVKDNRLYVINKITNFCYYNDDNIFPKSFSKKMRMEYRKDFLNSDNWGEPYLGDIYKEN